MPNLDVPVWSNDGTKVCYHGKPVRGADPKTFEVLLGDYARDANSVFFHHNKVTQADRATFRALNANFGVDANHAFFVFSQIKDADPKTFRVLDSSLVHNGSTRLSPKGVSPSRLCGVMPARSGLPAARVFTG